MRPEAIRSDKSTVAGRGAPFRPLRRNRTTTAFDWLLRGLGYRCDHKELECVEPLGGIGWSPRLAVTSAAALVAVAAANGLSLNGFVGASIALFWLSFALIVVPTASRLAWPNTSRAERILLLNILGAALYMTRILAHPTGFFSHDEYVHWSTTIDILERHHLFTANSLLPASPAYPGLEIVEASLVQLTNLSAYFCSVILITVLRIVLISSIFLIFEIISGSDWVGGLATLVYMASSNFYTFLIGFSYETIAIDFLSVGILVTILMAREYSFKRWRIICVSAPIFFALAVSHHVTSWIGVVILCFATASALARGDRRTALATAATACVAIVGLGFWKWLSGEVGYSYAGGIFGRSLFDFYRLLDGTHHGRALFVAENGAVQPVAYRIIGILSVLLISAGLVIGFFRSLGLPSVTISPAILPPGSARTAMLLGMRDNPWAIVLTISSFAFPPSVFLRLTSGGWELGNRMSAFVFLGVGLVVAVGAAMVLIRPRPSRARAAVVGLCLCLIIVGGIISELQQVVAQRYRPSADGASIEPMGISAALWTRRWLGRGWRFASDRTNRLLLATYGSQRIVTDEQDDEEPGYVIFSQATSDAKRKSLRLSDEDRKLLRLANVDYLLVDLRLQRGRPLFGFYFSAGEGAELHKSPPLAADLGKFDYLPRVGRIYDNGYEVIYDVKNLLEAERLNVAPRLDAATARVDSAAPVGRTVRSGGSPVQYPAGASTTARATRGGYGAVAKKVEERAIVNYDAGVTRYVTK